MSEFDDLEASGVMLRATFDQYAAISRPILVTIAEFEQSCVAAGMSERLAAAFTMKVAEGFGWPVIPGGSS